MSDQTITDGHETMLRGRIERALEDKLPALHAAIERAADLRDKVSLATVALDISSHATSDAFTLQDAGRISGPAADDLISRTIEGGRDAARECGMTLEELEEHAGY